MADIDLASFRDSALSSFDATLTETTESTAPPTETTSQVATPEPDKPDTPAPPPPEEKPLYKVKIDGEEKEVPLDELLNGYSRTSVWTQRMQALADERKAFEAAVQEAQTAVQAHLSQARQREEAINTFFANPANVEKWYRELTGAGQAPPPQAPQYDPGAILTAGEAERIIQDRLQRELGSVRSIVEQQAQQARAYAEQVAQAKQIEFAQLQRTAQNQTTLESHLSSLLAKHPLLAADDTIGDRIAEQVFQMNPNTVQEALEMMDALAQTKEERLRAAFIEQSKHQLVEREKLLTNRTEPPGGNAPVEVTPNFKLGDKRLTEHAMRYFTNLTAGV